MKSDDVPLVLVRNLSSQDDTRHQHARAVIRDDEVRVARGAYLPASAWQEMGTRERYLARVRAIAETRRSRPIVSHWSAAALHGLPSYAPWPEFVHLVQQPTCLTRSGNGVIRHRLPLPASDITEVDGILTTTLTRTSLDLAATASFVAGVVLLDFVLHVDRHGSRLPLSSRDELLALWESMLPFGGHIRALETIRFATTLADSPLESISRVNMRVIGCPRPQLQIPFRDADGFIGDVDFSWPDFGVIGEADGREKYVNPAMRNGRSVEQVVLDEKNREDRLRAQVRAVARWPYAVGANPAALRARLAATGLPMGVPWV